MRTFSIILYFLVSYIKGEFSYDVTGSLTDTSIDFNDYESLQLILSKTLDFTEQEFQVRLNKIRNWGTDRNVQLEFSLVCDLTKEQLVDRISTNPDIVISFLQETGSDSISSDEELLWKSTELSSNQSCQNGGRAKNDGSCVCPPFVTGDNCQTFTCSRYGIPVGSTCHCPPGWFAKNCEIRGCRPAVESNLDTSTRSLVLVFPLTSSMKPVLQSVRSSLPQTVQTLQSREPGWIRHFALETHVRVNNSLTYSFVYTTASLNALLDRIDGLQYFSENTAEQPTVNSIYNSIMSEPLSFFELVWAFFDGPDSDADDETFSMAQGGSSKEMPLVNAMLNHRSKLAMFYTGNEALQGKGYALYKRLSKYLHADLISMQSSEIPTVMSQLATKYYKNEDIDYRNSESSSNIPIWRDFDAQEVFLLVTVTDDGDLPMVTTDQNLRTSSMSSGAKWALYSVPMSTTTISLLNGTAWVSRVFVQSRQTALVAFNDNHLIDFGNGPNFADIPHYSTIRPKGIDGWSAVSYTPLHSDTRSKLMPPFFASLRSLDECSMPYLFDIWDYCPPGPFINEIEFSFGDGRRMRRVLPSFCAEQKYHTGDVPVTKPDPVGECSPANSVAVLDPRLSSIQQVMFVVETTTSMEANLAAIFNLITNVVNELQSVHFTLTTYDDRDVTTSVSTADKSNFLYYLNESMYVSSTSSYPVKALDAIYQSAQVCILPPCAIYHFTASLLANSQKNWIELPVGVQVNSFVLSNIPSPELESLQMTTSGKLLNINQNDFSQLKNLIVTCIDANNMIQTESIRDCSSGVTIPFVVESQADYFTITITGSSPDIQISNGAATNETIVSNDWSKINKYTVNSGGRQANWTATVKTSGSCIVQIQSSSSLSVMWDFTSDSQSDFPQRIPATLRGTDSNLYVVGLIRDRNGINNQNVKLTSVSVSSSAPSTFLLTGSTANSQMKTRGDQCYYQFISNNLQIPTTSLLSVQLFGTDGSGGYFSRQQFYRQLVDPHECHGITVNKFGECVCPTNYTGDTCWDRKCVNGATPSRGICVCGSGFYGDFCQNVLTGPHTDPTPLPDNKLATTLHCTLLLFVTTLLYLTNNV